MFIDIRHKYIIFQYVGTIVKYIVIRYKQIENDWQILDIRFSLNTMRNIL